VTIDVGCDRLRPYTGTKFVVVAGHNVSKASTEFLSSDYDHGMLSNFTFA
jgi:hypothetical protein